MIYVAGGTAEEVSQMCNIPLYEVHAHSARKQWQAKRRAARDLANKTIRQDLNKRIDQHRNSHQHHVLNMLEKTQAKIEQIQEHQIVIQKDPKSEDAKDQVELEKVISLTRQHDDLARRTLGLDKQENLDPTEQGFAFLVSMRSTKKDASAPLLLPDNKNDSAGILRSLNAISDDLETPILDAETTILRESRATGPNGAMDELPPMTNELGEPLPYRSLPRTMQFAPPTPKANEDPTPQG